MVLISFHFLTLRTELSLPYLPSHVYNFDHLPEALLWCFGDSLHSLEKFRTRTGGGLPKSLRHWRSLFARLPGFIDKDIRNVSYLFLFPERKLS